MCVIFVVRFNRQIDIISPVVVGNYGRNTRYLLTYLLTYLPTYLELDLMF